MKASHYRTPRTLAECEFVSGYPVITKTRHAPVWAVLWAVSFAAIGVLLALGV